MTELTTGEPRKYHRIGLLKPREDRLGEMRDVAEMIERMVADLLRRITEKRVRVTEGPRFLWYSSPGEPGWEANRLFIKWTEIDD